jgi:cytochrome P450
MSVVVGLFGCAFVVGTVALLVTFFRYRKGLSSSSAHPLVVRAKGHWFFGNVQDFAKENFLQTLIEFPLKYGPFVDCFLLSKRLLLITDAEAAREILLKRPKKFGRLKALKYAGEVLKISSSLFYARGNVWNRVRKSCVPSFSHLNVVNKVIVIAKEIMDWMDTTRAIPNLSSKALDMQHESFHITVRIITVVAFGLPTNHPLVAYFLGPFQQDVIKFFAFTGASAVFPFPRFLWKYSPKYQLEIEGREATARIVSECVNIINYKRQLVAEGQLTKSNCMIDTMVLNEGSSERALNDDEIVMNVRNFYTAGADTTATTITWGAYFFATIPEIAERVRQEAIDILFRHQAPKSILEDFDMEIFTKMTYTNAVISEILRIRSAASHNSFELEEENDEYQLANGITVRSGDMIYINIDGMQADPKIFEDPFQFNPDRWLTTDTEKLAKMKEVFMPFGFGPRICPGMGLAMHESLLALSMFVYYFRFTLDCPLEEIIRVSSFIAGANKMPLILTPRTDIIE